MTRSMNRKACSFALAFVAAFALASCAPKQETTTETTPPAEETTPPPAPMDTSSMTPPAGEITIEGVVTKVPVEGGCWVIKTADGTQYEPTVLVEDLRVEGEKVRAVVVPRPNMTSVCMVGPMVEIVRIERMAS
jgi:hypothetical protein